MNSQSCNTCPTRNLLTERDAILERGSAKLEETNRLSSEASLAISGIVIGVEISTRQQIAAVLEQDGIPYDEDGLSDLLANRIGGSSAVHERVVRLDRLASKHNELMDRLKALQKLQRELWLVVDACDGPSQERVWPLGRKITACAVREEVANRITLAKRQGGDTI